MVLQYMFAYIYIKSLTSTSDEWFIGFFWGSLLLEIFMIKKWVLFSLTSFGTLKYDCVIKTKEIFDFCF